MKRQDTWCVRDRDAVHGEVVKRRLRGLGIRDRPIAPMSPWQNAYVERLISSPRRECIDHVIVLDESHLRRIMSTYAGYYNETRTHLSLGKDVPIGRAIERFGRIVAQPMVGGLRRRYTRIWFFGRDRGRDSVVLRCRLAIFGRIAVILRRDRNRKAVGGGGGIRTPDTGIMIPLLYRLSYAAPPRRFRNKIGRR